MTMLPPATARPRLGRPTLSSDVGELAALAETLNGLPVPDVRMTERQFMNWRPAGVRAEWEAGEVILMTTPSVHHAELSGWFYRFLFAFAEYHDLGRVFLPITVRLAELERRRDPDVLFVSKSRLHQLRDNHLDGSPDLAIEIVSPDSVRRDWQTKHAEYAAAGVREYWIADPMNRQFGAYGLARKAYRPLTADADGRVHSKVLKGLYVRPAWLWRTPLPSVAKLLREMGCA